MDSDSGSDNSETRYFDPPIQNYSNLNMMRNRLTSNFAGDMFLIQRLSPTEVEENARNRSYLLEEDRQTPEQASKSFFDSQLDVEQHSRRTDDDF